MDIRSKSTKQRPCLTVITESISCCHHGNGWMTEPELMIAWFFWGIFLCLYMISTWDLREKMKRSWSSWDFATCMGFNKILLHFLPGLGMSQDFRYKICLPPVCVPQLHVPYYPIRAKKIGTTEMIHASLWLGRSRRSLSIHLVWDPNRDENDRTYRIWSKWFVLQKNAHAKSLLIVFESRFYVWLEVKINMVRCFWKWPACSLTSNWWW